MTSVACSKLPPPSSTDKGESSTDDDVRSVVVPCNIIQAPVAAVPPPLAQTISFTNARKVTVRHSDEHRN
jgi:hypothetical protein